MYPIVEEEVYDDGEPIFEEGSRGSVMYQVRSGAVVVSKTVGDKRIIIEVLRAGGVLAEELILGETEHDTSAHALGRAVVGVVNPSALVSEFENLSHPLQNLYKNLSDRLNRMMETAAGISTLRRQPRVRKTWSLAFRDGGQLKEAYSKDASLGGLFIKTPEPLDRGETFQLQINLPQYEEPIDIKCEVAWNRKETEDLEQFPVGMGVEFVEMSDGDYEKLERALQA
ncbi:MAG: PilZ domain-containing protein [Desulfatibacillaceae bacterium]